MALEHHPSYSLECPDQSQNEYGYPGAMVLNSAGNLYIADSNESRIRKVTASTGVISTMAGTGVSCSPSTAVCGDGGAATAAKLYNPEGLAIDSVGNLYIVDTGINRLRFVSAASGIITTVAGTGTQCSSTTRRAGTAARPRSPL